MYWSINSRCLLDVVPVACGQRCGNGTRRVMPTMSQWSGSRSRLPASNVDVVPKRNEKLHSRRSWQGALEKHYYGSHLDSLCSEFTDYLLQDLRAAFRDPNSPFYIPPGTTGPASPDEIPEPSTLSTPNNASDELENAHHKLLKNGFDPTSFWEQRIAWGDQDPFQYVFADAIRTNLTYFRHVNNVRYGNSLNFCTSDTR